METMIFESLLSKESIFAVLFVYLLIRQLKHTERQQATNEYREEKLYNFLDGMRDEFAKLVRQYERLSNDVEDIKGELKEHRKKGEK